MAVPNNVNAPTGLSIVSKVDGAPATGTPEMVWVPSSYATALFIGDPVVIVASAADVNNYGVLNVNLGTAGSAILGVIVGVEPVLGQSPPNLYQTYKPASVGQYLYVYQFTGDEVIRGQLNGASAATDIGKNINFATGAGNTVNGISGAVLNTASVNITSTLNFHILRCSRVAGNNFTGTYALYDCCANVFQLGQSVAGV